MKKPEIFEKYILKFAIITTLMLTKIKTAGNLQESMKIVSNYPQMYQTSPPSQQQQQQQSVPPPSYYETQYQRNNVLRSTNPAYGLPPPTPQNTSQPRCSLHRIQPCTCNTMQNLVSNMSPNSYQQNDTAASLVASMSPNSYQSDMSPSSYQNDASQYLMQDQTQQSRSQPHSPPQQTSTTTQQQPQTTTTTTTQQQQVPSNDTISAIPSTIMGQLMGALNNSNLLDDLNINIDEFNDFGCCDIDAVSINAILILFAPISMSRLN